MRHQNITISIPDDLKACLFAKVGNRSRSLFISNAIRKALFDEEERLKKELEVAYEAANRDSDRKRILRDWDASDDLSEWVNDDEDWSWLTKKKEKRKNG